MCKWVQLRSCTDLHAVQNETFLLYTVKPTAVEERPPVMPRPDLDESTVADLEILNKLDSNSCEVLPVTSAAGVALSGSGATTAADV